MTQRIEKHLNSVSQSYELNYIGHRMNQPNDDSLIFKVLEIGNTRSQQLHPQPILGKQGYYRLSVKSETQQPISLYAGRLHSRLESTFLVDHIQNSISESSLMNGNVHIRRYASYVRLLVTELEPKMGRGNEGINVPLKGCKVKGSTPLFYIDLLYASKATDEKFYFARPFESDEEWKSILQEMSKAWRPSHSVEAKNAMYGPQHGCLKIVFRMLKVIRNREVALQPLSPYHLKPLSCE